MTVPDIWGGEPMPAIPDPPLESVRQIAKSLTASLGLHLFGFDIITSTTGHHSIIDVNYFPG
jgi:D-alanine-D-alanine ligase-like ATP-grasp enzyme